MKQKYKTKCFAFDMRKTECKALTVSDCVDCHFYKTHEEWMRGRRAARHRLMQRPADEIKYYAEKYYGAARLPRNDIK